ncbi:hypothetical protein BKA80DRAFT_260350 [Phyllosticta citrichinensis]
MRNQNGARWMPMNGLNGSCWWWRRSGNRQRSDRCSLRLHCGVGLAGFAGFGESMTTRKA